MNRCRLAQELMYQYAYEARVDIVFITESYRQQTYWFNDDKGDTSLWVTLFKGKQADSTTLVAKDGIVGINVGDVFCIGGYCSPNVSMEQFSSYVNELDTLIRVAKRSYPAMMIADDFNSKSTAWGGRPQENLPPGYDNEKWNCTNQKDVHGLHVL